MLLRLCEKGDAEASPRRPSATSSGADGCATRNGGGGRASSTSPGQSGSRQQLLPRGMSGPKSLHWRHRMYRAQQLRTSRLPKEQLSSAVTYMLGRASCRRRRSNVQESDRLHRIRLVRAHCANALRPSNKTPRSPRRSICASGLNTASRSFGRPATG